MRTNRIYSITLLVIAVFLMTLSLSTVTDASDLTPMERLGKNLFFDDISSPDWVSCATCHSPAVGWTGPNPGINKGGAVYRGAIPTRFGNRKPPSAAYASLSPVFYFNAEEGMFIGGNFWDGRATGEKFGNPAADQALGPFLNPVEQNNPDKQSVCEQVAISAYADLFEIVWGPGTLDCSISGVDLMFDRIGLSIAAYEGSSEVNQYSSKYDAFVDAKAELSAEEAWGLELFEGKANCVNCHPTGAHSAFTDFTYDNLGVPRNPENPFYEMDSEFLNNGVPINPAGENWVDTGLGGFLQSVPEWQDIAGEQMGKQKVPTLRNVGKRYGNSPKAFTHNGYFKSLKGVVHFYNTRDVKARCPNPFTSERDAMQMDCWPVPEVEDNLNSDELGDLGLTDAEEDAVVAFMNTLSDGFKVKKNTK